MLHPLQATQIGSRAASETAPPHASARDWHTPGGKTRVNAKNVIEWQAAQQLKGVQRGCGGRCREDRVAGLVCPDDYFHSLPHSLTLSYYSLPSYCNL